jgi:hypothetical protein
VERSTLQEWGKNFYLAACCRIGLRTNMEGPMISVNKVKGNRKNEQVVSICQVEISFLTVFTVPD